MIRMKRNEMKISHAAQTQPVQEPKQGSAPDKRRSSRTKLSAAIIAAMTTVALVLSPFAVTGQALTASAAAANQAAALAPFEKLEIQNKEQIQYAIKHNLVQPLNTVVKKDGYQLALKGFIADKYNMIILFTAQTDSKRAFTIQPPVGHALTLTDAITGKVISGRKMNDAIVLGVSPAKQNNIMHGAAVIRLTTPLPTAPKKVAGEFVLTSLSGSELKQLEAVQAQMSAEMKKAYDANPKTTTFKTSPALLKKYDALKGKIKKSPPLKVSFEINPKVWEQESQKLSPEETLDVAGHKIKINLELTPLTTIITLSSDEQGLFKDKAFLKTLNSEYYPTLMVERGNGEYTSQQGGSAYSYTEQEVRIVAESYFQLNQPKSIRLDFKNVIKSTVSQQVIVDLSNQ